VAVTTSEFVNLAGSVEKLLFAREEGVALSAHFNLQFSATVSGARLKTVAAATVHGYFMIIGMYISLH
jgi:hypothetical protein